MMTPAELSTTLSSFKTAYDITKAMLDLREAAAIQSKVIELQRIILESQKSCTELIATVGELEKEVSKLKAWDADKQRYELADSGLGTFAYRLKPEAEGAEPIHLLCAHCYADHQKSVLQSTDKLDGRRRRVLACHRCKSTVAF
jgi:hypothetical protein